jgi:oxygen-dependent protoporphyrinogen oxidase
LIRGLAKGAKKRREAGRPAAPKLISFRGGLQALTDAMASRLPPGAVELGAEVRRAGRGERARWRIEWVRGQECAQEEFDAVVSAVPSQSLSRLEIGGAGERPLEVLAQVEQPPVASLFLGFRREQIRHPLDGFGVLVPSVEKRSVLGILFNSTLFEGRAPDGHVALTVMCGGSLQADIARLPHDQLLATVQRDLAELIGAQGEPVFVRRSFWPRAIPQYNIGYDRYLDAISACERTWAGLFIGGNVKGGIALTDCLKSGSSLAKRVS